MSSKSLLHGEGHHFDLPSCHSVQLFTGILVFRVDDLQLQAGAVLGHASHVARADYHSLPDMQRLSGKGFHPLGERLELLQINGALVQDGHPDRQQRLGQVTVGHALAVHLYIEEPNLR